MLYPTCGRSLKPNRIAGAVTSARELLRRLGNPRETPRIPLDIRHEARALLRFFPTTQALHPVLQSSFQLQDHPLPKTWPIWPEHEFE